MKTRMALLIVGAMLAIAMTPALAQNVIEQVHQDFSKDPGWEGWNNRVVAENPPTKTEDFGYSATKRSSSAPGEIGGTMWCTRTPAWYAMPIGKPLSYKDPISISGRIALVKIEGSGYLGFFNSTRQEWRPWSSLALRLANSRRGEALHGKDTPGAQLWVDYMTATWKASFMVLDSFIPADGSVHTFSLEYDPNAVVDTHWPDPRVEELFKKGQKLSEQDIFSAINQKDPKLTREALRAILDKARSQGLLEYDPHHDSNYWEPKRDPDKVKGRLTFQLDHDPPQQSFLDAGIQDEPTVMDRFGLFNLQNPEGRTIEFYASDLVINGQKVDLSHDPQWQGMGNHVSFVERDFHPGQNYGYSQTNWAGGKAGEIGGLFWRNEPVDPYHGFYADDIGELTLEDPISFSGTINFVTGGTDASMVFGYFNRENVMKPVTQDNTKSKAQMLGIRIADSTSVGYNFTPAVVGAGGSASKSGPQFVPDRRQRRFTFAYDPRENDGEGLITATLDDAVVTLKIKGSELRKAGARFDRFGLMNVRSGGKYVEVYLDDLTYTTKRAPGFKPVFHTDKPVKVPYPPMGRMY